MSDTPSFRTRHIAVTPAIYSSLRAYADLHDLSCPEVAAELFLSERIAREPQLEKWQRLSRKAFDDIKKQLRAEQQPDDDQMPT